MGGPRCVRYRALLLAVGPQGRDDPHGTLRATLAELARLHPRRFVLHDFNADVVPYYQAADLLLLPSFKEGLPNVVLEAMACGLPCVAASASGSRELIVNGVTGFTYTPDDTTALCVAVRECLSPAGRQLGWQCAPAGRRKLLDPQSGRRLPGPLRSAAGRHRAG
jgi:glycosyltransferase involved in cell wall biosynthesis